MLNRLVPNLYLRFKCFKKYETYPVHKSDSLTQSVYDRQSENVRTFHAYVFPRAATYICIHEVLSIK